MTVSWPAIYPKAKALILGSFLCAAALGCQSTKKKSDDRPDDGSQKANTGLVDGNGAEIRTRAKFDLPNTAEVDAFLARLEPAEQVWVALLRKGLHSSGQEAVLFAATDSACFLQQSPSTEVRAYFDKITNTVIFCKKFHDGDAEEKLAIVLHELTHHLFYKARINLGAGEEDVVQLFESTYRQISKAADAPTLKAGVLDLRSLIDKYAAKVLGVIAELDLAKFLGPISPIKILKNSDVTYPVPQHFLADDYIVPHFVEYALNRYWTTESSFKAADLLKLPRDSAVPSDPHFVDRIYPYSAYSTAESNHVDFIEVEAIKPDCTSITCTPKLTISTIDLSQATDEFRAFIKSAQYGKRWIRTIDHREDADGTSYRRDRVFYFIER